MAIIDDKPSLPVEWFEMEELNGNCGKRSGRPPLRIPQDFATLGAAMNAATPGDDIVISHTATGVSIADTIIPEKAAAGPTTPRMPPTQKRPITMSRAITSAH